jgi:hypothetical protein
MPLFYVYHVRLRKSRSARPADRVLKSFGLRMNLKKV